MAKKIVSFKNNAENVEVWLDIASTEVERSNLSRAIYKILSLYGLENEVKRKNQSTLIIVGLGNVEYCVDVTNDIFDEYVDWYTNRRN